MKEKIAAILQKNECEIFGFCRFDDLLPLLEVRCKSRVPSGAKSVITVLFPYFTSIPKERNLSLYCIGKDYHTIILDKLKSIASELTAAFEKNTFEPFCDISPINEVKAAYLSGLGVLGRNNLLINQKYGSFVFVGEIITDLEIKEVGAPLGFCITCGKCIISCPSSSLKFSGNDKTFSLDTTSCLSSLTQKKGELTDEETALIYDGGLVWGCDECQLACPLNKSAAVTPIGNFHESQMPVLTRENIDGCADRAYGYKGKNILLRNLSIIEEK